MKIALFEIPYDSGHRDFRTGAGPRYLADGGLVEALESNGHDVERLTLVASDEPTTEIATAFDLYRQLAAGVRGALGRGAFPLVLAGNCNCVVGTLGGLPAEGLGLAFFDGHGDFNTPETTATGFLDGMGLAMAVGRCWKSMAASIEGFVPLEEKRAIQIGARDLDALERSALEASDVTWLSVEEAVGPALDAALDALAARQLYLHFDMDVLEPKRARANRFAPPDGLSVEGLLEIAARLRSRCEVPAVSIASVEPACDDGERTLEATMRLVETLFPAESGP